MPSCVNVALTKYDTLTALSSDPRNQKYRDMIAANGEDGAGGVAQVRRALRYAGRSVLGTG